MTFIPADSISLVIFLILSFLMLAMILLGFKKIKPGIKGPAIWAGYFIIFNVVVLSGLPAKHIIPIVPLLFISLLGLYIYLALSEVGTKTVATFSPAVLIGFQVFRLPLELVLHQWASVGTVPVTMTWTGQNFDIVTGVLSLISIPFLKGSRKLASTVNVIGFLLLLNVLRVVVMSSPLPFSWPLENPLQLIFYYPYCLIAPLFVGPALFGHIVAFRKLKK